jgi:DNA end-binding protein Ku
LPRNATATELKGGKHQTIAFGLVNVPVRIKPVEVTKRQRTISANFICGEHMEKARQVYVCDQAGKTHGAGEAIEKVRGYPVDGGYVVLDDDVLEEIIAEKTGAITIDQFVPADEVDPLFFAKTYLLGPDEGGHPTYDLLAKAISTAGVIGVGTAVLAGTKKTQLVAIRYSGFAEQLILQTCKFDSEINWADIDAVANGIKSRPAPTAANLKLAAQIIDGLAGDFDPSSVEDEYQKALGDLIAKAASGQKLVAPKVKAAPVTPVDDLMTKLQESVAQAKKAGKKPAKTKAAA